MRGIDHFRLPVPTCNGLQPESGLEPDHSKRRLVPTNTAVDDHRNFDILAHRIDLSGLDLSGIPETYLRRAGEISVLV